MIKQRRFDKTTNSYTDEIEDIELDDYIRISVMRKYSPKIFNIKAEDLEKYCDDNIVIVSDDDSKENLLNTILLRITKKEKLEFCDLFHIGVTKYHYLAAGMTEKEYEKIRKKLTVVGKESMTGAQFKYLYSVSEYLQYIENNDEFMKSMNV